MNQKQFIQQLREKLIERGDNYSADWAEGILNHPSMKSILRYYEPVDFEISQTLIDDQNISGTQILRLRRKSPSVPGFYPINNIGVYLQDTIDSFDTEDWFIPGTYQISSEYIIIYQSFIS